MSLWGSIKRSTSGAFTSKWPRTARVLGTAIGITEVVAWLLPPHQTPDSGLLGFAAGLILIPNATAAQEKRHKGRDE